VQAVALIRFDDVTLGYDRHPAVHHLQGEIAEGSLLAVVGPNGAGKSTLLKGIVGLLKPLEGAIRVQVKHEQIAYLPQQAELDRGFPITCFDTVAMGLWRHIGPFGAIDRRLRGQVFDALAAVGLEGFAKRAIGSLSGGQLQRVLFARLLLQDASLILLDEPFTAIDAKTEADLIALIQHWRGEHRTILTVLHDLDQVRANFPQTLLLARECVALGRTAETLNAENLSTARRLCEAWDENAVLCQRGRDAA
jgi:zinc/manganese transport system ATP-binding protein